MPSRVCEAFERRHVDQFRDHDPELERRRRRPWRRALDRVKRISPEVGDALLYGVSALFALGTIYTSTNALYQVWGRMALSPFAFGALASAVLAWMLRRARRRRPGGRADPAPAPPRLAGPRSCVAVCVFAGALAIPLGLEILWRFDGVTGSHLQPEVVAVEVGGQDLVRGQDPYHPLVKAAPPGQVPRPGAARLRRASCPTSRSWPCWASRARSGPTTG